MSSNTPPSDSTTKPEPQVELEAALRAIAKMIDAIDPGDGAEAAAKLEVALPFDGPVVGRIRELCDVGMRDGWLLPNAAGPSVQFGRVAKDMEGYAVDVVRMANGAGLGHTHTKGEINMCFPLDGEPKFDGLAPGWVVFPPGSHHVPTVTGGTMLFVYFTPEGAVVWDKR